MSERPASPEPQKAIPSQVRASEAPARILVAEDDVSLRTLLRLSLGNLGYEVIAVEDGEKALQAFLEHLPDLVILDIMMPRRNGLEVLQEIRKRSDVPVIMLTALGRPDDVVKGLDLGADDYIPKPFTFKEVEARVRAALRRARWAREQRPSGLLSGCGVRLDAAAREVWVDGRPVHLSRIEFDLLYALMSRQGQVVDKETLFQEVWGYEYRGESNLVEVAIRRLRSKIEADPARPRRIVTVRGVGYKFCPDE